MPKSHKKKMRRGGGMFDNLTSGFDTSSWMSGMTTGSWNPFAKKEQAPTPASVVAPAPVAPAPVASMPVAPAPTPMGGRRRRSRRGGGYSPNMSSTNLAASASPVSEIKMAQAQNWVGGKTRRRHNRRRHSRKHRR